MVRKNYEPNPLRVDRCCIFEGMQGMDKLNWKGFLNDPVFPAYASPAPPLGPLRVRICRLVDRFSTWPALSAPCTFDRRRQRCNCLDWVNAGSSIGQTGVRTGSQLAPDPMPGLPTPVMHLGKDDSPVQTECVSVQKLGLGGSLYFLWLWLCF